MKNHAQHFDIQKAFVHPLFGALNGAFDIIKNGISVVPTIYLESMLALFIGYVILWVWYNFYR